MISRHIYKESDALNNKIVDPTDYTIMLKGLPIQGLDEDNFIAEFCEYADIKKEDIARFVFTYNISKFSKVKKKYDLYYKIKQLIDNYRISLVANGMSHELASTQYPSSVTGCTQKFKDYNDVIAKLKIQQDKLQEMQLNPDAKLQNAPILFITFNKASLRDEVYSKYKAGVLKKFVIKNNGHSHTIELHSAQMPNSIIWENLHITNQIARSILTWFITLLIIVASFAGNYFLKKNGSLYATRLANTHNLNNIKVKIYTFLSSVIIMIINVIVIIVMPILTKLEHHISVTDYQSSTSFKLAIAQFINSALVPLLINYKAKSYFSANGLIDQVLFNWVFLLFTTPLIEIFDVPNIISHIRMCSAQRKGNESELMQSEANEIFLPPNQPMHIKYSNILLFVYYSAFYIQLYPPGIILFLIGVALNYISDKMLTIKRYSKNEIPSEPLAIFTANSVVGGVLLMVVSNVIYVINFENSISKKLIYGIVPVGIIAIVILLSVFFFNQTDRTGKCVKFAECFFWKQAITKKDSSKPYDILIFGDEDFMALNPLTRRKALLEQIELKLKEPRSNETEKLTTMKEELKKSRDCLMFPKTNNINDIQSRSQFNPMETCAAVNLSFNEEKKDESEIKERYTLLRDSPSS